MAPPEMRGLFSFSFGVDRDYRTVSRCVIFGAVTAVKCARIFIRSSDKYGDSAML